MSYQTRKFLAQIDLFGGLPDDVLDDLIQRGATIRSRPGEHVIDQGNTSDTGLRVVLEGDAEVQVNGVTRRQLAPGDYFGEISLIDGSPRSATVVSGPDGLTTFALSSLAFSPVMTENPAVAQTMLKALCARIRSFDSSGDTTS